MAHIWNIKIYQITSMAIIEQFIINLLMLTPPNQANNQHIATTLQTIINRYLKTSCFTKLKEDQKLTSKDMQCDELLPIQHSLQFEYGQDIKVVHALLQGIQGKVGARATQRRILELEIKNEFLNVQNRKLKEQLDESMKRQERQNLKKKESLEMLAEELQEKNDMIEELKRMIRKYEEGGAECDILQDELTEMKIAASSFEKIRSRLDYDIDRKNKRIIELEQQLDELTSSFTLLQLRLQTQQGSRERVRLVESQLQKEKKMFQKLAKGLKAKLKRAQKECGSCLKLGDSLIAQMKLQFIFNYLNSSCEQVTLFDINIFTQTEMQILTKHKQLIDSLQNQKQPIDNIDSPDFSELIVKGNRAIEDNILQAFDSPKSSLSQPSHPLAPRNVISADNSGKLMQVEEERRKLVDKIVELKMNSMKIRDMILQFLIKLNLMQNKDEALSRDQLLTQILQHFQYSEDELKAVFRRKKKLFDFL